MIRSNCVLFHGPQLPLEWREANLAEPAQGELLVRVEGCTLCGSDLHTIHGRRAVPVPTILGHEIVGEIMAMGDAAPRQDLAGSPLEIGDRVVWSLVANCGRCFYCQRGLPQKCVQAVKYGHEANVPGREFLGGLAEHCRIVPGTAMVKLNRDLPLAVACPASCGTATIAAAIEAAGTIEDRVVVVSGCGLLGLTACAMAASAGAAAIIGVDVVPERLAMARQFGATHGASPAEAGDILAQLTAGHGADVVIECSGSVTAIESLLPQVRLGGRLILVGSVFPSDPLLLAPDQLVRRNLTLVGIHNYAPPHLLAAVRFLNDQWQRYPIADLVSAWYPLSQIDAAVARARDAIRIGIRPGTL